MAEAYRPGGRLAPLAEPPRRVRLTCFSACEPPTVPVGPSRQVSTQERSGPVSRRDDPVADAPELERAPGGPGQWLLLLQQQAGNAGTARRSSAVLLTAAADGSPGHVRQPGGPAAGCRGRDGDDPCGARHRRRREPWAFEGRGGRAVGSVDVGAAEGDGRGTLHRRRPNRSGSVRAAGPEPDRWLAAAHLERVPERKRDQGRPPARSSTRQPTTRSSSTPAPKASGRSARRNRPRPGRRSSGSSTVTRKDPRDGTSSTGAAVRP